MTQNQQNQKDFHHIIRRCQTLNAMNKRLMKLQENMSTLDPDVRRRRYISIQVAQEKLALQEHELHCEMANLGIADLNEDRYGNVTLTFQFGPTSLYFRRPNEDSAIPAVVQTEDSARLTPLEMAIEEERRDLPDMKTEYPGDEQHVKNVEAHLSYHRKLRDAGHPNEVSLWEDRLRRAKERVEGKGGNLTAADAFIQEEAMKKPKGPAEVDETTQANLNFLEDTAKKLDAAVDKHLEEVDLKASDGPSLENWGKKMEQETKPAEPMKLKDAQKIFDQTGEVPEGFTLISGKVYKKYQGDDPDRHMKTAADLAEDEPKADPPAEPVKKAKKEAAPKKEPAPKKQEQPELTKDTSDGPFAPGSRQVGDDLMW